MIEKNKRVEMTIRVSVYESVDQDEKFYGVMGQHFASLEHKMELGGWQIYNKPGSVWFLIFDGKILLGFCALYKSNICVLDNFVILKASRGKGYSKVLYQSVLNYMCENQLKVRVLSKEDGLLLGYFKTSGFNETGKKGTYISLLFDNY